MATQVQFRRGTTTQNNAFTGAIAELTVDTEAKTLRLHDGSTAGGGAVIATLAGTQTFTNKTLSSNSVWQGTAIGLAYGGTNANITAASSETAFFLRLAPSVSNSIAGQFGDRDLINRSQLLLQKLQLQSDKSVQVYGILNPGNIDASSLTWTSVNTTALGSQPSFAQVSTSSTTTATPGEQVFSTLGPPAGFAEIDLSSLKELSNSAIGGYSNFPDGPDVLAVVVKNLSADTATVNLNLFWSEAQA